MQVKTGVGTGTVGDGAASRYSYLRLRLRNPVIYCTEGNFENCQGPKFRPQNPKRAAKYSVRPVKPEDKFLAE
jgi:hypothetical protein